MRYDIKKNLLAASLAGTLALTATPVGATSLYLDMNSYSSTSTSTNSSSSSREHHNTDASVQSNTTVQADAASVPARCKKYDGTNRDDCVKIYNARAEANGQAKADVDTHGKFVSELRKTEQTTVVNVETRFKSVLHRVFQGFAKIAKRACGNENANTMKECTNGIKTRLQANVSAMIEAAFTF